MLPSAFWGTWPEMKARRPRTRTQVKGNLRCAGTWNGAGSANPISANLTSILAILRNLCIQLRIENETLLGRGLIARANEDRGFNPAIDRNVWQIGWNEKIITRIHLFPVLQSGTCPQFHLTAAHQIKSGLMMFMHMRPGALAWLQGNNAKPE